MRRMLLMIAALMPVSVLALEYTDVTDQYTDRPFSRGEAAGISILTHLGAVQGNPDGTFAAERPVNRAEFLKIAYMSHPKIQAIGADAGDCFPDVHASDWFSPYVCLSKRRGDIEGYPDGTFKPANTVNYVEALKMLIELYERAPADVTEPWFKRYVDQADQDQLLLPSTLAYDAPLTRGNVARLAASFRAFADGELALYRSFERGEPVVSSASSSIASETSLASSSSSSASSRATSASSSGLGFPATSRFVLVGQLSPVLFDGTFTAPEEDAVLRNVRLTLRREIRAIESIVLVTSTGTPVATLKLATDTNEDKKKWEALAIDGGIKFIKDVPVLIGVRAQLKARESGGSSNELVELESFSMDVQGVQTGGTRNLVPASPRTPIHQTALSRITGLTSIDAVGSIEEGQSKKLATFQLTGETTTGATLRIESLEFLLQTTDVNLSHLRIGGEDPLEQADCSIELNNGTRVICAVIPEAFRRIGTEPVVLSIYGDIVLRQGVQSGTLQVVAEQRGAIGQSGTLRWSDGSGTFNWIEAWIPLVSPPQATITR